MPNSFGDLTKSEIIHDFLDDLVLDLEPLFGLAHDFSEENIGGGTLRTARPGSTVKFKQWKPTGNVVYDVDPDDGYEAQDVTLPEEIPVTLPSTIKAASMKLTAEEYRQLIGAPPGLDGYNRLRDRWKREAMQQLAEAIVAAFHAQITAENYPAAFVSAPGSFDKAAEIDVDAKLFGRKLIDRANAQVVLPAASTYKEWAKDHLPILENTGEAQVGRTMGLGFQSKVTPFKFWRTNVDMPEDAARGYAITRTAMGFVARIPDEPTYERDPVSLMEVVHPKFNFGCLFRVWKEPKKPTIQFDIALIFKFFALQAEALERLVAEEED